MNVEISVSSALAKARALDALRDQGYDALSGSVRLAYPFAIQVDDVDDRAAAAVVDLVTVVDPGADVIEVVASS